MPFIAVKFRGFTNSMRTSFFYLLLYFLVFPSYGQIQSNISQIKRKLISAEGHERFDLINDLAWEYRFANPDSSIILANEAYSYGEFIKLKSGLARSLNILGIANNYKGNKLSAYDYYSWALDISQKQKDSVQIAYTYNNLGRIFQEQGLTEKAFPNIIKASEIFERLNDSTGLAYCFQSLGNLYQSQRNYERAEENFLKGLALRVLLDNQRNIHGGYYLIGRLYAEQGKADQSLRYLHKADSVGRHLGDEIQLAETWIYIAKSYLELGLNSKADSLLNVSLNIIRNKNAVRILSNGLLIGGEVAMERGDYKKALALFDEALINSRKVGDLSTTQDVYYQLWKLNEKRNDKLGALYNQNQYLLLRDTLKSRDVARQEEQLSFEREILAREHENASLKSANSVIEQRQKFQAILFGSVLLSILIIGVTIWWNSRRMRNINAQLAKQNDQLLQLNHEKDSLMSIVAHDLKAPLNKIQGLSNLLRLDGELSKDQSHYVALMDQVTKEGLSFISDLLSVHALEESHTTEVSEFDAAEVVKSKIEAAFGVANEKNIRLRLFLNSVVVKSDADYLGRITDNLVSNAIKFSPKNTEVLVSLAQERDQLRLIVEDNGPGFSEKDKVHLFKKFKKLSARPTGGESSNGLGLAIVKTLVDRLGGKIELDSAQGTGSKFIVSLPLMVA